MFGLHPFATKQIYMKYVTICFSAIAAILNSQPSIIHCITYDMIIMEYHVPWLLNYNIVKFVEALPLPCGASSVAMRWLWHVGSEHSAYKHFGVSKWSKAAKKCQIWMALCIERETCYMFQLRLTSLSEFDQNKFEDGLAPKAVQSRCHHVQNSRPVERLEGLLVRSELWYTPWQYDWWMTLHSIHDLQVYRAFTHRNCLFI